MQVLDFLKNYWVLIVFLGTSLSAFFVFIIAMIEGIKCSLRNDILTIYDRCKEKQQITYYELEAIMHSYKIYRLLRGNSFVEEIVKRVQQFELID